MLLRDLLAAGGSDCEGRGYHQTAELEPEPPYTTSHPLDAHGNAPAEPASADCDRGYWPDPDDRTW
jgi:hypothetical protein